MDPDSDYYECSDDDVDDEDEKVVLLQNMYYHAKGIVGDGALDALQIQHALGSLAKVVEQDIPKSDWSFKALKQLVKLNFKLSNYVDALVHYNTLLQFAAHNNITSKNYSEQSVGNLLDFVSTCTNLDFLQEFYETTIATLKHSKNERLLFKSYMKLGKLYLQRSQFTRLNKILKELHKSNLRADGTEDLKKGNQLLEVYSLEIQMHDATKNTKKLKGLYQKCLSIKSVIPHPRILGTIRECGGKMHMLEREWSKAHTDFFEAFKNYDEAASPLRIRCLKYVVLANMLTLSRINPFDSPEAKPYMYTPEIVVMTQLQTAYMQNNVIDFERILRDNRKSILDNDEFIKFYMDDILKNIRSQVVLNLLKPYTRVKIPFIESSLNIPAVEVESLLVSLILDNKISAMIDQVNNCVLLSRAHERTNGRTKYIAINKWTTHLTSLQNTIISSFR